MTKSLQCVRHRIDGLEKAQSIWMTYQKVRHRIDGLEKLGGAPSRAAFRSPSHRWFRKASS